MARAEFPALSRKCGRLASEPNLCPGRCHRICRARHFHLDARGPKVPGQRPPRPRRALLARPVGRCPPWSRA